MLKLENFYIVINDQYLFGFRASTQCIRTMTSDYALCSLFAPGDRHVIIGTKVGYPANQSMLYISFTVVETSGIKIKTLHVFCFLQ